MAGSLHQRLLVAEDAFILAASQGPEELIKFDHLWTQLETDINTALEQGLLDEHTLLLAHQVFGRVSIFAEGLLDLDQEIDAFSSTIEQEIDKIVLDIKLDDDGSNQRPSHKIDMHLPSPPTIARLASDWLLQNLSNPYPSREDKISIAHMSSSSLKDVDAWFVNARRRIGWTSLCANHFGNKRGAIIHAATKYFANLETNGDSSPGASSSLNFDAYFAQIQVRALELGDPSESLRSTSETSGSLSLFDAYPSPSSTPPQSRHASPATIPRSDVTRKRRVSSCSSDISDCYQSTEPQTKKRRFSGRTSKKAVASYLPSPSASPETRVISPPHPETSHSNLKRKRKQEAPEYNDLVHKRHQSRRLNDQHSLLLPAEFLCNMSWNGSNALELHNAFPDPVAVLAVESEPNSTDVVQCYQYPLSPPQSEDGKEQFGAALPEISVTNMPGPGDEFCPIPTSSITCSSTPTLSHEFGLSNTTINFDTLLDPFLSYDLDALSFGSCLNGDSSLSTNFGWCYEAETGALGLPTLSDGHPKVNLDLYFERQELSSILLQGAH